MRTGYFMFFVFIIMSGFGFAADAPNSSNTTQAIFTKVQGKVQVLVPNHKKPKKAQKDLVVTQGDKIVTQEGSSAVLRLFDGSELRVDPQTRVCFGLKCKSRRMQTRTSNLVCSSVNWPRW